MTAISRRNRRAPSLSVIEVCCALAITSGPTTPELTECVASPAEGWTIDAILDDMATLGLVVRSSATLVTRWSLTPRGAQIAHLEESARRVARSRERSNVTDDILREISREILTLIREPST